MTSNVFFFKHSIYLEVYLIGYKTEGESILFLIKSKEDTLFCGVVDCYEYQNINKTIELLESENINRIDFLCWTHPDLDHSLGIDNLVERYIDINTQVILPEGISGDEIQYNDRVKKTFEKIDGLIKPRRGKRKYNVKSASDYKVLKRLTFRNYEEDIIFEIRSIAPNSTIVRSRKQSKDIEKNDFSIALILSVGEINVLLAGDIENYTIKNFEEWYIPEKIDCLKIPHHTSKTSNKILNFIYPEYKCDIASTTVYRNNNLPDIDLINIYKDVTSEFYCTGSLVPTNELYQFGIILMRFDILNKIYNVYLEGNAAQIF